VAGMKKTNDHAYLLYMFIILIEIYL